MNAISMTVAQLKPGKRNEVDEFMAQRADTISSISGLLNWGYADSGENEITVIAVYDSKSAAENATQYVTTILGEVAPLVAAQPVRNIYEAHWH